MERTVALEKTVALKDGRDAIVRNARPGDIDKLHAFFCAQPPEDRRFLRRDVTQRAVLEYRFREMDAGRVLRLLAFVDDEIVADGALELEGQGWFEDQAEIRIIVAQPYQRLGLGTLMARELFFLAAQNKVTRIVARMLRPQVGAQRIFHKLGFRQEFVIPEHVHDLAGDWQDLVVMRCDLEDLWREMEALMSDSDWRRHR
jgi:RimJ/RimL family protein N-acetyltransferase